MTCSQYIKDIVLDVLLSFLVAFCCLLYAIGLHSLQLFNAHPAQRTVDLMSASAHQRRGVSRKVRFEQTRLGLDTCAATCGSRPPGTKKNPVSFRAQYIFRCSRFSCPVMRDSPRAPGFLRFLRRKASLARGRSGGREDNRKALIFSTQRRVATWNRSDDWSAKCCSIASSQYQSIFLAT